LKKKTKKRKKRRKIEKKDAKSCTIFRSIAAAALRTPLRRRGGFEKAGAMEENVKMGKICFRCAGSE